MNETRWRLTPTFWRLACVLLVLVVGWGLFHRPIANSISMNLLLRSHVPSPEWFTEVANQSRAPVAFLERCLATGQVVHRQLVMGFLKDKALAQASWFDSARPLVVAGTSDGDMSVRELALAILEMDHDPALQSCAAAQLNDVDPLVRLLGLDYLAKTDARQGVPCCARMLQDPDLRVVTRAEVALMRWSDLDFGVRGRLAIPSADDATDKTNLETIHRGIEKRENWWQQHSNDYPVVVKASPGLGLVESASGSLIGADQETLLATRHPLPDFMLRDLQGRRVHLSEFRGKVVLINFWATWCTACLAEIPDLIALQNKLGAQVVILGVALDGVPDEHGDSQEEAGNSEAGHPKPTLDAVRTTVARAVKARGINYEVLLDPAGTVGGRFNGGELPTTVIVDAQGRLRRRFVGERNLAVFEAMLGEAR